MVDPPVDGPQPPGVVPGVDLPPAAEPPPSTVDPVVPGDGGTGSPLGLVPVSVRTGYGWAWVVSGLLLSFLAGSGLLALNRRWLAPDLSGCPLEGRLP